MRYAHRTLQSQYSDLCQVRHHCDFQFNRGRQTNQRDEVTLEKVSELAVEFNVLDKSQEIDLMCFSVNHNHEAETIAPNVLTEYLEISDDKDTLDDKPEIDTGVDGPYILIMTVFAIIVVVSLIISYNGT